MLDQVSEDADVTLISRRDAKNAVIMSHEHFESLMETFHLLKTPANAKHLEKSIEEYHSGKVEEHDLIND